MKMSDKYKMIRKEFRHDLWKEMKQNHAIAALVNAVYCMSRQEITLNKIQECALTLDKKDCQKINDIMWRFRLCGNFHEVWANLRYACPDIVDKYIYLLPESLALADALAVKIAFEKTNLNQKGRM